VVRPSQFDKESKLQVMAANVDVAVGVLVVIRF